MAKDPSAEISMTSVELTKLTATVEKLTSSMGRLATSQGAMRTSSRDSMSAIKGYMESMNGGMTNLLVAIQKMRQDIHAGFTNMSGSMQTSFSQATQNLEKEAARSGKAVGEAYNSNLRRTMAKNATAQYETLAKEWAIGSSGAGRNVKLTGLGALAAANAEVPDGSLAALARLKSSGATLSAAHSALVLKYEADLRATASAARRTLKEAQAEDARYEAALKALAARQTLDGFAASRGAGAVLGTSRLSILANAADERAAAKALEDKAKAHTASTLAADRSSKALLENSKTLSIWSGHANDAHSAARGLASGFGLLWLTWGNMAPLLAGAAVSYSFAGILKTGSEVNHILESMRILTDQAATSTAALNAQLLELARSGPIGPKGIAEAMKQLSLAGLSKPEISHAIRPTLNLSVVGDIDLKKSADTLTGLGTAFGLTAQHYHYIADVIAKASATSKASVESIADAMRMASVIHKQYGVSLEDMALGVSALNNLNIVGGAAGTALRNMYVDLSGRSSESRRALKQLGVDVKDANGKFKDLVTITLELQKALDNVGSSANAQKYLQILTSERGSKPIVELLSLGKQKANDGQYANRLEEMRAKNNDPGYSTIKAAETATTARKQMESVVSGLQATMVESFSIMEPYILRVSVALKEAFASDGFKLALKTLTTLVGNLTVFLADHAGAITLVGLAYGGLKIVEGLALGFSAFTRSTILSTAASKLDTTAKTEAAAAQARLNAVIAASNYSAIATGAQSLANGLSFLATWASRLVAGLGVLILAMEGYKIVKDLVFGVDKTEAMRIKHEEFTKSIAEQAKAIDLANEAKRKGIELDDLILGKKAEETAGYSKLSIAAARAAYTKAVEDQAKDLDSPNWARRTAAEKGTSASSFAVTKAWNALKKAQDEADQAEANLSKIKEDRRIKANEAREKMIPGKIGAETGNLGAPIEGAPSHISQRAAQQVRAEEDAHNRILSLARQQNATQMYLVESQHKHRLISEEEFNSRKLQLIDAAFKQETDLVLNRQKVLAETNNKLRVERLKSLGVNLGPESSPESITEASKKFLNLDSAQFTAKYPDKTQRVSAKHAIEELYDLNQQSEKIRNVTEEALGKRTDEQLRRTGEAANALAGAYRDVELELAKVVKEMDAYYAKQSAARIDPKTDPFERVWDKAGREARVRAMGELQSKLAKIDADIAVREKAILSNPQATEDSLQKEYDMLVKIKSIREETLQVGTIRASNEGADATKHAKEQETNKVIGGISTDFAKAVSASVFDGGVVGAEMLEKYLRDMFLRKPFEMILEAGFNQAAKSVVGSDTLTSLADWTKGIFGGGGGKSSTTVDEFGQVVEAQSSLFDSFKGLFKVTDSSATVAATTNMSASTLFSSAVAAFTSAVAMLGAASTANSAGGFAGLFSGTGSSGFMNDAGGMEFAGSLGFASGGQMNPFSLAEVNENGTEMLTVGGRDYLMTGGQSAVITPTTQMPTTSGGINHSITINVDSRTDQAQVQALVAGAVRRGNAQLVDQLQQSGAFAR